MYMYIPSDTYRLMFIYSTKCPNRSEYLIQLCTVYLIVLNSL